MHIALIAWVLLQPACKLKWLQGVVGRWVSDFIVRRPAFACFDQVWIRIARGPERAPLPAEVRDELLLAACVAPLLYTDMRLPVDPYPVATDASLDGGA
eukprot:7500289-Heterocapsa_arctica.AAC.1